MSEISYELRCYRIARFISLMIAGLSSYLFLYILFDEFETWWFAGIWLFLYFVVLALLKKQADGSDKMLEKDDSYWLMLLIVVLVSLGFGTVIGAGIVLFSWLIGNDETDGMFNFGFWFGFIPIFISQFSSLTYQALIRNIEPTAEE